MPKLGVNIDHVATLRQARKTIYPDPVEAAAICEEAGCDSIVCHLREDRRHISDNDLFLLRKSVMTKLNMEMSAAEEIVGIACRVKPDMATLVPEKREELTTEGGLQVIKAFSKIKKVIATLNESGIPASLFVDPDKEMIKASQDAGAGIIELHTGEYADAGDGTEKGRLLAKITECAEYALSLGLVVNAGHGLNYNNVKLISDIKGVHELNIGHSIIAYAVLFGLKDAVTKMKEAVR